MKFWTWLPALALLATANAWWLRGCSSKTNKDKEGHSKKADDKGEHKDHKEGEHKKEDHKEKEGEHHDKPLTEKDVKMPASFKEGVARLEELHKKIEHHIEHDELAKVHRVAEEMALVAKKMKELAGKEIAEDRQVEAGRLCNEVAGYYKPIDEAADAGKKAETQALHKKMGGAIAKLKALAK